MTTPRNARQTKFAKWSAEPKHVTRIWLKDGWSSKPELWVREGEKISRASRRRWRRNYVQNNDRPEFYDWTLKSVDPLFNRKHTYQQSWLTLRDRGTVLNGNRLRHLHTTYRKRH